MLYILPKLMALVCVCPGIWCWPARTIMWKGSPAFWFTPVLNLLFFSHPTTLAPPLAFILFVMLPLSFRGRTVTLFTRSHASASCLDAYLWIFVHLSQIYLSIVLTKPKSAWASVCKLNTHTCPHTRLTNPFGFKSSRNMWIYACVYQLWVFTLCLYTEVCLSCPLQKMLSHLPVPMSPRNGP